MGQARGVCAREPGLGYWHWKVCFLCLGRRGRFCYQSPVNLRMQVSSIYPSAIHVPPQINALTRPSARLGLEL
jgi:hypothetical protein